MISKYGKRGVSQAGVLILSLKRYQHISINAATSATATFFLPPSASVRPLVKMTRSVKTGSDLLKTLMGVAGGMLPNVCSPVSAIRR
ncbi:hypothetical protein D3C87_1765710 [compost metagenome]